jgi:1-deoxy-D-xylulose-5-phosphate reductoisomerase
MKKRLIILGSTGSIGRKTLEVVSDFPESFEIVAISSNSSLDLLERQAQKFSPRAIAVCDSRLSNETEAIAAASGARAHIGPGSLLELVSEYDADMIVVATVGFVGLAPTLTAIERGITVGLANKEVLVTAGEIVMQRALDKSVRILPIDSEHNAIFQCMNGSSGSAIRRVMLTASGGPFRGWNREKMSQIKREDALRHPTWNMGPKITIDSATMMNKGFEVIEGMHLFGLPVEKIEVVVHPQSTIHSMVEYVDGSILAQLGVTDMYFPIQNVLFYPQRVLNKFESLDFGKLSQLTFFPPDVESFPCLGYAYEAAKAGGTYPTVLNAANEMAVARFLAGEISFLRIAEIIRSALDEHESCSCHDLQQIQAADNWAREMAGKA